MREEAEEAQDAQIVLGHPLGSITDDAQRARFEVRVSTDVVEYVAVRIRIERVDGEIAPLGIRLPVGAEGNLRTTPVG